MQTLADKIIDALGGTTAVAKLIEAPLSTVHSWRRIGIPASRLAHLKLAAKAAGKRIDWETGRSLDHDEGDTGSPHASESGNIERISAPQQVSA